jgi:hypothetical protein
LGVASVKIERFGRTGTDPKEAKQVPPIIPRLTSDQATAAIVKTLRTRGVQKPDRLLAKARYMVVPWFQDSMFDVVVRLACKQDKVPPQYLRHTIAEAIRDNATTLAGKGTTIHRVHFCRFDTESVRYVSLGADSPRAHPPGLNQCRRILNRPPLIHHDELRFRSQGEVAIYDELKRRDVLVFPCAAAVLGQSAAEFGGVRIEKLEPDFLVCYKGKWGILEVNGDAFHSGPVTTAKDHDRARKFKKYGLFFVEAFSADECRANPTEVVDQFLMLLGRQK